MGKGQSKHGHCYVVNAHFNPLCQLEENNSRNSIETPLTSQDSGLQLTPELSFTLSEDNKSGSEKNLMTKCALQVFLPQDNVIKAEKEADMDVNPEKADEEKSEKAEKQMMVECVSVNDVEKQEFSFVLYNFNGEEAEKEDVEKMVVRSICDALKSTLKLPPSGTHTLKVHLTVSPDGNTKLSPQNQTCNDECSRTGDKESSHGQGKIPKTGCNQKKNVDFVLPAHSSPSKHSDAYPKCCSQDSDFPKLVQCPTTDIKQSALRSPCMKRNCHSAVQKQESQKWTDTNETSQDSGDLNGLFSAHNLDLRERRHRNHHNRHQNHRDRIHYQEFPKSEGINDMKQNCNKPNISDPRHTDPSYCATHLMDKSSVCYSQNPDFPECRNHKKTSLNFQKLQNPELHSHILKYKLLREAKSNMLDLSFDLCDLNGKPDMEPNHHRRSKSYDLNESQSNCCMLNSPKVRHRDYVESNCGAHHYPHSYIPQSPSRHHRHRHRERDKNKQRAMQQVASWLEKEHLGNVEQKQSSDSSLHNQNGSVVERHEYHHIHEHHHYYHYVDS